MFQSNVDLSGRFKMTELGPLPEEWVVVRLGEIAKFTQRPKGLVLGKQIAFVPMELIPDNASMKPGHRLIEPSELKSGTYCEPGDVLVARITPCFENGKQAIVPNNHRVVWFTSTEVFPLKTNPQVVERNFLFYYLRLPYVRQEIAAKMEGTTGRQRIPKQVLANHLLPLPPLPEQRAIASVLRAVQRAKEATEQVIQAMRELKKSLMRYLFTYGPVPVNEVDKVPLKETEVGLVPEHWEVRSLKNAATFVRDSIRPLNYPDEIFNYYSIPAYQETGGPILETGKKVRSQKLIVEANDVLFGKLNPRVPKVLLVAASRRRKIASTEFIPLRSKQGTIVSKYLYYLCWSDYVMPKAQELVSGSTPSRQRIDVKTFLTLPIPIPPISEQHEIARILQAVDKKLHAEEARKQALEGLFKTLLHDLMTGKIRVNNISLTETTEVK